MKRCPQCGSMYSDDRLNFCLADGTPLTFTSEHDETTTLVRQRDVVPKTQVGNNKSGVSSIFKYLTIVLVALILLLGLAGVFVWSYWNSDTARNTSAPSERPPALPVRSPDIVQQSNSDVRPEPSPTITMERAPAPSPQLDTVIKDAGIVRIRFRRGSISETVRGIVSVRRSYVLRTMEGQKLFATVGSPGNCVILDGGADTLELNTPSGDVMMMINNQCETPSPFTLKVTVR